VATKISDVVSPGNLIDLNGILFFSGKDSSNDDELYYLSGTSTTATKIDINPSASSYPSNLTAMDGSLYFSADGGDGYGMENYEGGYNEL
jgi:ELWxxDGT repeat protein